MSPGYPEAPPLTLRSTTDRPSIPARVPTALEQVVLRAARFRTATMGCAALRGGHGEARRQRHLEDGAGNCSSHHYGDLSTRRIIRQI
ncbi:unnamed protein product [Merluccius merluccius]